MTDAIFTCRVYGTPRPQGSKRGFATKTGKVAMVEASGEGLRTWRGQVAAAVRENRPEQPYDGPVDLYVTFYLARPAKPKHKTAPSGPPDVDKLCRALFDQLTGIVVTDDARIVGLHATKIWAVPPHTDFGPGAYVRVEPALPAAVWG